MSADATQKASGKSSRVRESMLFVGLALIGLGAAAAGAVAVFTTDSGAGAAALLTVGGVFVLVAVLNDRLESFRYGNLEVALRDKSEEAASRGDMKAAEVFERAAATLRQRATRTRRSYRAVRSGLPGGPERTAKMDEIITEARRDAYAPDVNDDDVLTCLWTGSEGTRVWALGVLQARPELATTRAVLEAVQRPDQMFDQYQALLLAERFSALETTHTWARERIATAVRGQLESGALGDDRDSLLVANRILEH